MRRTSPMIAMIALLAGCVVEDELGEAGDRALMVGDPLHDALAAIDVSHWEGPLSQHEMDCFWTEGVRHVVAGTQVREVTRQQLAMAVARGMIVDAYVYVHWDQDPAAQLATAFDVVAGFPIGRMWIDAEEAPGGRGAAVIIDAIQRAVDACRAHGGVDCGLYTGSGFWRSAVANTTQLADVPLWHAWYDHDPRLDTWATQQFGGWSFPVGKQWAEEALCGVGVDKDSLQVVSAPAVVVDRTPPPAPTAVPPAPVGLYPAEGDVVGLDYVKLMAGSVAGATSWQFGLELWDAPGQRWVPYYTWTAAVPFRKVVPVYDDRFFRHHVRAKNGFGWGAWSAWAVFAYGQPTGAPPGSTPPPPPPPPPSSGVPGSLAPDGVTLSSPSVTMTWSAVTGATQYTDAIEYLVGGVWQPYTTYTTTAASKTFYPQTHGTSYRFRVRARVGGVDGAWSSYATFVYQ